MRKIYVDLGAYDGDSVLKFLERKDSKEFDIYAFEPNPDLFDKLFQLVDVDEDIFISPAAAWITNETREFAVDKTETPMGSTLMPGKESIWSKFEHMEIHCFDFSDWIRQFKDDYLIVKMDIEGAEFPILKKMIEDGTDKLVDLLWVEMHPNKVKEYTSTYAQTLLGQLSCPYEEWD